MQTQVREVGVPAVAGSTPVRVSLETAPARPSRALEVGAAGVALFWTSLGLGLGVQLLGEPLEVRQDQEHLLRHQNCSPLVAEVLPSSIDSAVGEPQKLEDCRRAPTVDTAASAVLDTGADYSPPVSELAELESPPVQRAGSPHPGGTSPCARRAYLLIRFFHQRADSIDTATPLSSETESERFYLKQSNLPLALCLSSSPTNR